MQQVIVQREIVIDAPLSHVWQLVATEEGLYQWWGNTIHLEAKEGGRCEEWRSDGQRSTHWQGVVTTYAPPRELLLTLRAQQAQQDEPELTTIAITLEANATGEQTRVQVTQRAFGPMTAIGKPLQTDEEIYPSKTQSVPLAQLQHPAPGAYPQPSMTQAPTVGRIEPAYNLLTQQQRDAWNVTWQQRLAALAISVTALPGTQ